MMQFSPHAFQSDRKSGVPSGKRLQKLWRKIHHAINGKTHELSMVMTSIAFCM
jgi:hypothetical protein